MICFNAGPSNICIVQVAMNKLKIQLLYKPFTRNSFGFVHFLYGISMFSFLQLKIPKNFVMLSLKISKLSI